MTKVKKIVIPVAGYGTRFLPFTKSIPKEMLPIVDRPVIQHIVQEAVAAGIEEVILITGYSKRAIEDYFDYNLELEYLLEGKGKTAEKNLIREISDIAKFIYVRQKEQRGTGHAILQAKELINDEPFMVVGGDDLFMGQPSMAQTLINTYQKHEKPVMMTMEYDRPEDYDKYGYMKLGDEIEPGIHRITEVVEKPGYDNRPSSHASFMGYILPPEIFPILDNQPAGKNGEIQITEAINTLAQQQEFISVACNHLRRFDCGDKLDYMKATVEYGIAREDVGEKFREYLKSLSL